MIEKIKKKLWSKTVNYAKNKKWYTFLYKAYWKTKTRKINPNTIKQYFTAIPNPGAGIGHQIANWIAGYWFAQQFNLKFAHIPFSSAKWEAFLGFGNGEITVQELIKKQGYKKIMLPLFNETNEKETALINSIIGSYAGKKIIFICEQDQFHRDQFGIQEVMQEKFSKSKIRKSEKLIYSKDNYNIAIHVRRGDIVIGQTNNNPNLLMRWQNNDYFTNVLSNVLKQLKTDKPIAIYLFSQGVETDFPEFKKFENLSFCLDMNAQDSFSHMVFADLLITSKSSFSYKPALLNKGIKVCPANFWHGYPETKDWILVDDDGIIENEQMINL
ncbi:hypothetical protein [Algibacter sp. L1A34]|uniref:hypothetical protein n=1 Tax=Algibacter sp. L1A34 TaxID=2686365 RepID=UPI00131CB01B|nr:hypothetical protein [Algibacter sp. L1A34]